MLDTFGVEIRGCYMSGEAQLSAGYDWFMSPRVPSPEVSAWWLDSYSRN